MSDNAHKELGIMRKEAVVKAYTSLAACMVETSQALKAFAVHFGKIEDSEDLILHSVVPVFVDITGASHVPADDGEKKPRKKTPKDPNAPKRPASAYIDYQNVVRAAMRAAHPELAYQEVVKLITADWAALENTPEKQKYLDATAAKVAAYDVEKAAYDAKLAEEAIARGEEPAAPTKKRARKTDAAATEKNNSAMLTDAAATITKAKKDKAPSSKKAKVAPIPEPVAESSSDESSEEEDDEEEEEVAAPVKKASSSNGKAKAKEAEAKKVKKSKA